MLCYASTKAWYFTASDVVVYYHLKQCNGNANKRVHDAIQRLVKRGFLKKIDRGVYELAVDISPDLLKCEENSMVKCKESSMVEVKENLSPSGFFNSLC